MIGRNKIIAVVILPAAILFLCAPLLYAQPKGNPPDPKGGPGAGPDRRQDNSAVNKPWEKKADVNRDGTVDKAEINKWRQRDQKQGSNAMQEKAVVNQGWEKAADTNRDGIVDEVEINRWKNRESNQGENPAVVDRGWEKQADANQDGIVDEAEINHWRKGRPHKGDDAYTEPQGYSGASPDMKQDNSAVNRPWEKKADANKDGTVDKAEINKWRQNKPDRDNNPPGPKGGKGTNWENKPGPQGGPGAGPDKRMGGNPPGPKGGPGGRR